MMKQEKGTSRKEMTNTAKRTSSSWNNSTPPTVLESIGRNTADGGLADHANGDTSASTSTKSKRDKGYPGEAVWIGPLWDWSGYSEEARGFVAGLRRLGYPLRAQSFTKEQPEVRTALRRDAPEVAKLLYEAVNLADRRDQLPPVAIVHAPPDVQEAYENAWSSEYMVARTMFETDGLPQSWPIVLNAVNEIWVPSHFNQETFKDAGVKAPVHVVPGGVDTRRFRPGLVPLSIPGLRGTVYLSIFQWSLHKGYDVLLGAWAEAFTPKDDVCLLLRCYPRSSNSPADAYEQIRTAIVEELERIGSSLDAVAPIVLLSNPLSPAELPRLMATCDIYVAPSRGEGYGRPQMEAMACGLPVIATRWSGNLEYMDDHNSLLIEIEDVVQVDDRMDLDQFQGQRWAEPSKSHLAELLRSTAKKPKWLNSLSRQGRKDIVSRFTWEAVASSVFSRLQEISKDLHGTSTAAPARVPMDAPFGDRSSSPITVRWVGDIKLAKTQSPIRSSPITVRWVGDIYAHHSLARVNRELSKALADLGVSIHHSTEELLSVKGFSAREAQGFGKEHGPITTNLGNSGRSDGIRGEIGQHSLDPSKYIDRMDVEIRHRFPPYCSPASAGQVVTIQPWEFIGVPAAWVRALNTCSNEIWCPSQWIKEQYARCGIDESRVYVVPNGVDTELFKPEGNTYPLSTSKSFKFLFVGGSILRKGIDILLDVYLSTFTPIDDVCLVIKTFGSNTVYRRGNLDKELYKASKDPTLPEIELIDEDLGDEEMAELYRSCDVVVHPYRGEGFGLPIAEAMASGLPVIVTREGGAKEFCREDNAYLIPAFERPTTIGDFPPSVLGSYRWYEPDRRELKAALQYVVSHPKEAEKMGTKARETIVSEFTWKKAAETAYQRLKTLLR